MPKKQPVILLLSQQTMWWRAMLSGVANYSHLRGHWSFFNHPITLYSGRWAFAQTAYRKTKVLPLIERVKPDAMIISDSVTDYEEAAALGLPLIAYRSVGKDIPGIPMIVTDNEAGGKVAAEHLPERGFQDFAFCGYDDCYWSTDRCKGFNNAIAQAGHSNIVYQHLKPQSRSWETEQPYLIEWLKSLPKPIGLMACNDERGLDITTACMAAGISVPEEIAVVGMDNDELVCILSTPPTFDSAPQRRKGRICRRRDSRQDDAAQETRQTNHTCPAGPCHRQAIHRYPGRTGPRGRKGGEVHSRTGRAKPPCQ